MATGNPIVRLSAAVTTSALDLWWALEGGDDDAVADALDVFAGAVTAYQLALCEQALTS